MICPVAHRAVSGKQVGFYAQPGLAPLLRLGQKKPRRVLRRFAGRWEAVSKVLPYCDEAHFFDNDNGFVEVAEYKNGELLLVGDLRPAWVLELQRYLLRAESAKEGDAE